MNTLTDELTGKAGIQTDHGSIGIGDLIVLVLDAVLMIYTAWRSYDFLTTTVPSGYEILGLVGLWGLDIGAVAWSMVWIFGSSTKYQDWTSMSFFILDLTGVILTSITDSLLYGAADNSLTAVLANISTFAIPLVVVFNVIAGFIYHMTSPETNARRSERKADAAYRVKMNEITTMERDLLYAESYLLAKQDTLDKAVLLAEIKKAQDAVEKSTRDTLRDQVGIRTAGPEAGRPIQEMKARLAALNGKSPDPINKEEERTAPAIVGGAPRASIIPALQMPPFPEKIDLTHFPSKIACALNDQWINLNDPLTARKAGDRYEIGLPGAAAPFANVSEEDFRLLHDGPLGIPEPAAIKGNGHHKPSPL